MSAVQNYTLDIDPGPNLPLPEARFRTAHNARLRECRANSPGAGPRRGPNAADRFCVPEAPFASPVDAVVDRCPDNQVDGIWPQKTSPKRVATLSTRCGLCGKCRQTLATDQHGFTRINRSKPPKMLIRENPWQTVSLDTIRT